MCRSPASTKITCASVVGMKGLFWKRVFTPEATANFSHVWLFDSDVEVCLGLLVHWLRSTDAHLATRTVRVYRLFSADG